MLSETSLSLKDKHCTIALVQVTQNRHSPETENRVELTRAGGDEGNLNWSFNGAELLLERKKSSETAGGGGCTAL